MKEKGKRVVRVGSEVPTPVIVEIGEWIISNVNEEEKIFNTRYSRKKNLDLFDLDDKFPQNKKDQEY